MPTSDLESDTKVAGEKSPVARFLDKFKNSKLFAPIFIVSAIVAGLAGFTDSVSKVSELAIKIYDPTQAHKRSVARSKRDQLSAFVRKYESSGILNLSYTAFLLQDERFPEALKRIWDQSGLPRDDLSAVERLYELEDYLLINRHIPFRDPRDMLPNLWFVVDSLSSQRNRPLQDFVLRNINYGNRTKYDEYSYRLYSSALTAEPTLLAEEYAKRFMFDVRANYNKYAELIKFMNGLEWDIKYLPVPQFMLQNRAAAIEFMDIEREIRAELPAEKSEVAGYTARERIRNYEVYLERLSRQ